MIQSLENENFIGIYRILKNAILSSTCIVLNRPSNKRKVLASIVGGGIMARPTCADAAQPCQPASMSEKTTRCNGVAFLSYFTIILSLPGLF